MLYFSTFDILDIAQEGGDMAEKEKAQWYNRMKRLRVLRELTQEEAGERIGVTQGSYGRWERGEHKPIRIYQDKIAKVFKVSREKIFD